MSKFKEDFEKWYIPFIRKEVLGSRLFDDTILDDFYRLPIFMQFGIYQLFADSIGFYIVIDFYFIRNEYELYIPNCNIQEYFPTRQQVMKEAVKQFEIWYNE